MKILIDVDSSFNMVSADGMPQGVYTGTPTEYVEKGSITLDLIKQGVSPDDIIKMKNNDLL